MNIQEILTTQSLTKENMEIFFILFVAFLAILAFIIINFIVINMVKRRERLERQQLIDKHRRSREKFYMSLRSGSSSNSNDDMMNFTLLQSSIHNSHIEDNRNRTYDGYGSGSSSSSYDSSYSDSSSSSSSSDSSSSSSSD